MIDIIKLAALCSQNGQLITLPSHHPDYFTSSAEELAVIGVMPVHGSLRVMRLVAIKKNEEACNYFQNHANFRVFAAQEFSCQPSDELDVEIL